MEPTFQQLKAHADTAFWAWLDAKKSDAGVPEAWDTLVETEAAVAAHPSYDGNAGLYTIECE
jgi:hypothetical protein